MPKLKKEVYDKVIEDYKSGLSQLQVAEKNGLCRDAIGKILRRENIEVRDYTGDRQHNRKWEWDFRFFTHRDEITAYWAGFLMADGSIQNVSKGSYLLVLSLAEKDKDHLFQFCDDVGISRDSVYITNPKENELVKGAGLQYRVHLTGTNLKDDLSPWGIINRKTYNFSIPDVSKELLPHYLRGWIDGDGYVYRNTTSARISVFGNIEALNWFSDSLHSIGYDGCIQVKSTSELHGKLYIGGSDQVNEAILALESDNCSRKLDRKWCAEYNVPKPHAYTHTCQMCGKEFGVTKYRHENEEENGRFCSRDCFNDYQRSFSSKYIIESGVEKIYCSSCKKYVVKEEFSASSSYCKSCWNRMARERRSSKKA